MNDAYWLLAAFVFGWDKYRVFHYAADCWQQGKVFVKYLINYLCFLLLEYE